MNKIKILSSDLVVNRKAEKYKEKETMFSTVVANNNAPGVSVVDFIFNSEDGSLKKIASELSKKETKEVLNRLVDNNYEQYCK
jgi:hypothetical protein